MTLFAPDVAINQPANPKPLESVGIRSYPDFHVDVTDALVDGLKGVSVERVTGDLEWAVYRPATGVSTSGNGANLIIRELWF